MRHLPISRSRNDGASDQRMRSIASAAARAGFAAVVGMQVARLAARIVFAAALALLAGGMIEHSTFSISALCIACLAMLASSGAGITADTAQASCEERTAGAIRDRIEAHLARLPGRALQDMPAGAVVAGLQRYPGSVAALAVGHRAAALMLVLGPLLTSCAMLMVSWEAALALIVASPVMIVFFILVGGAIHERASRQEAAFGRLAAQFEDRIRALPTILAADATDMEKAKLGQRMRAYADSTFAVLRVAFLNAGIIDFFSSISIAILAVLLGLGHLKLIAVPGFSALELWQSLFILMLAPEFFAPLRRYAEQYHVKSEGTAAAAALDAMMAPASAPPATGAACGADADAVAARLPDRGLVAIVGPSGSGKSTLLRRLAGVDGGRGAVIDPLAGVAWVSTDIHVRAGTLAGAMCPAGFDPCPTKLMMTAARLGLLDDRLLPGGLSARVEAGGENLSGGQRLRIGVARALLSPRTILADEPTAKLDAANAARVRLALSDCSRDRLVVVATHDRDLAALAETVIDLGGARHRAEAST